MQAAEYLALCLTFVRVADPDEALIRYDGFPATRRDSVADLSQWSRPADVWPVVAGRFGDGVLLAEENGYHATRPGVLERLSAGTVAATVFWNVSTSSRLAYAADGVVQSTFDFVANGDDPSAATPFLAGLKFRPGHAKETALVFLERIAGAHLTAQWLRTDHPASLIVAPDHFSPVARLETILPGVADHHWSPRSPLPDETRPVLHSRAAARAKALREAAELAAFRVAPPEAPRPDPASLSEEERSALRARLLLSARESCRDGLEWFWELPEEDDDDEPTGGSLDDLIAEQEAEAAGEAESVRARRQAHGWAAARDRLLADPREALRGVLTQARRADPEGWPALEREIRTILDAAE